MTANVAVALSQTTLSASVDVTKSPQNLPANISIPFCEIAIGAARLSFSNIKGSFGISAIVKAATPALERDVQKLGARVACTALQRYIPTSAAPFINKLTTELAPLIAPPAVSPEPTALPKGTDSASLRYFDFAAKSFAGRCA